MGILAHLPSLYPIRLAWLVHHGRRPRHIGRRPRGPPRDQPSSGQSGEHLRGRVLDSRSWCVLPSWSPRFHRCLLFRRFLPMLCCLVLDSSSSSLHLFPSPVVLCRHTPYRSLPLCNCCPCRVTFLCHGRFRLIWLFRPVPLYPSFIVSLFSPSTISRLTPGYCSFFHCKCLTSPPFLLYYFYDLTSHRGRPYD